MKFIYLQLSVLELRNFCCKMSNLWNKVNKVHFCCKIVKVKGISCFRWAMGVSYRWRWGQQRGHSRRRRHRSLCLPPQTPSSPSRTEPSLPWQGTPRKQAPLKHKHTQKVPTRSRCMMGHPRISQPIRTLYLPSVPSLCRWCHHVPSCRSTLEGGRGWVAQCCHLLDQQMNHSETVLGAHS